MYAALWRALPGGRLAKGLQCLALLALAVTVLFLWVFPAVASHLPYQQVTVEPGATGGAGAGLVAGLASARRDRRD